MRYLPGHKGFVQGLDFSPDGRYLASASADKTARVWDLATSKEHQVFPTGEDWAGAVAFSPDGEWLCTGNNDGRVLLWDLNVGGKIGTDKERQGRVTGIDFTPDRKWLAWSSYKGLFIGDPASYAPRYCRTPLSVLYFLSFNTDGSILATAGNGPEVFLHDPASGAVVGQYAHADPQGCWDLAFSPNGRTLALALGGSLQLWDASGHLHARFPHHEVVSGVVFSPDGTRLLTCSWDETVRLYEFDPVRSRVVRTIETYDWHLGRLFDVAISPDGTLAAAGGKEEPYLVVWDVE
jgi:WD40 repeat protein